MPIVNNESATTTPCVLAKPSNTTAATMADTPNNTVAKTLNRKIFLPLMTTLQIRDRVARRASRRKIL